MNIPGMLDQKNRENVADWEWRRHLQGGCFHWCARDLQDLRTLKQMEDGREIETRVRELRRQALEPRKVVNLAKLRIERARKKA